jgi:predicted transcriptional regulator
MVTHMKTTIELPDALLHEAQRVARERHTTLRALMEIALRDVVAAARAETSEFRLRDASVDGDGLLPEFEGASWAEVRDAIYGDRA